MCGIAFAFRPELDGHALSRHMERCLAAMAHRGPDGHGLTGDDTSWSMGHRRLAVIDPEGSPQPFRDVTGRYQLTYNGELYNYKSLRKQLEDHWSFRSLGDVEVVLAGLCLHGPSFLDRMEGMWALALWDSTERSLLLVRDRMGQKPLYYQCDGHRFACASELNALRALSWFAWQEDMRSTADYLRYGYYLPGTTAYGGVREVLPGHWLRWKVDAAPIQKPYWILRPGGFDRSRSEAMDLLRYRLIEGVRRRLVADVEVGALLSGGVDSSLIVGIVRHHLKQSIKTFTMGFSDASFDERPFARRIARHFHTRHYEECLDLDDRGRLVDLVLKHMGQPFADGSLLPTALVCAMAARQVKVVVSGDGGDELFSGYQRYLARVLLRWYTRLPKALRSLGQRMLFAFPEPDVHHSVSVLKKAHLFMDVAERMEQEQPYVAPLYYTQSDLCRLIPDACRCGHQPPGMEYRTRLDDLHRMMTSDALIYLPQDILAKVDRASMAFSLEARSPFLDRRVVELAFAMPRQWHRIGWKAKRMLRDSFRADLPEWIWRRRKHGFGIPVHQWFRSGLQVHLKALLEETDHPLNRSFVNDVLASHVSGRRDQGQRLWQIYTYLLWRGNAPWQPY
jgi:asparagine synthase (glutamine-hydrolysing)